MEMSYEEVIKELETLNGVMIEIRDGAAELTLSGRFVLALEVAREALAKIQKIAPVGDVYPDWYERLSSLEYNYYCMEKNGEPWYRAKDVWACIEPVSEEHREFGGKDD